MEVGHAAQCQAPVRADRHVFLPHIGRVDEQFERHFEDIVDFLLLGREGGRSRTTAFTSWQPPAWENVNEAAAAQRTPDLSAVLQEVVDRDDYTESSAIVLLIEGTGKRVARSYNGSATLAPSICVEYRLHMPEICDDGLDNDGDGLTDCDDPDCFGREECLEICGEEGCIKIGDYGDGGLCYHWEPADRVQGDASGPRVTVCPGATTTFIRTGTDENGDVKSRDEYTVTVFPLGDLTIDPEAPVFCAEPVTLTAAEGFEHYVWLDEMGNELGVGATYEATAPGVYTAEAEDSASGCLVRAGVEVSGTFEVEITASEALLCQEAATPVILDAGEGKSYEWRREGAVLGTDRTQEAAEPGLYEVTVTSLEDCVAEGEIEVGDASQADEIRDMLAAMGFYAVPISILGDDGPVQAPKTNEELVVDEASLRIQLVDDDFNIRASLEEFLLDPYVELPDGKRAFITKNENYCDPNGLWADIEAGFAAAPFAYWAHLWESPDENGQDYLLIKGKNPQGETPGSGGQVAVLDRLLATVGQEPETYSFTSKDQQLVYVLTDQLAGYYDVELTEESLESPVGSGGQASGGLDPDPCDGLDGEIICLNSAGIPIRLPSGSILLFGTESEIQVATDNRALMSFYDGTQSWYSFHSKWDRKHTGFKTLRDKIPYTFTPLSEGQCLNVYLGQAEKRITGSLSSREVCRDVNILLRPYRSNLQYASNITGAGMHVTEFEDPAVGAFCGVSQSSYTFTTCRPKITLDDFKNLEQNVVLNPYGDGGILYKYKKDGDQDFTLIYGRSDTFDPEDISYYFWNECLGIWEEFILQAPPQVVTDNFPILMSIVRFLPEVFRGELDLGLSHVDPHEALDILGFIPVVGELADLANGAWYIVEGEFKTATISLVSAFGADLAFKGAKYWYKARRARAFGRVLCISIQGSPETSLFLAGAALFSGRNCRGKNILADDMGRIMNRIGFDFATGNKFTQWLLDQQVDIDIVQKLNDKILAGDVAYVEKYLGIWRRGDELGLPAETLHTLSKDVLLGGGDELLEALAGRPGLVRAWETAVQHGDDIRLDVDFLTKLGNHFDEFPDLKSDLNDLDVFNAYKKIADDVEQSYEILDDVDGNLALLIAQKTSDSKAPDFWKWIHIGKKFEADYLLPKLRNRGSPEYLQLKNAASQKLGVDLDEFDMYSQVQLKYNDSDYFVADQVYVKWAINPVTGLDEVQDIVVVENKLRSTTRLTTSQNAGRAASSLEVRSNNLEPQSAITGKLLPKGETINSNNNWLKVYDSDSGDVITGIDKL